MPSSLTPSLPSLPRPHLLARLRQRPLVRLVVLRAPGGFGKTALLAQLRQQLEEEGALCLMLTLEAADNDASRFVARLAAAMADGMAGAMVGEVAGGIPGLLSTRMASAAGGASTATGAATDAASATPEALLRGLSAIDGPMALLIDDFEQLHDAGVLAFLRALLTRLPPQGQLVTAGRDHPDLGLGRLRARGDLLELDAAALRFSEADSHAFLADQPLVELPPGGALQLHRKTEGWPAGLAMAAAVLQRLPAGNDFMRQLCASDQALAAYLREAVLDQLGYETQQLLLRTSLLRRLEPALCELLLPGCHAARLLERLAGDRFLVTRVAADGAAAMDGADSAAGETEPVWRMHRLFAEVLRDRLTRTQPDLALRLHLIASGWYEARGRIDAAIDHAIEGGDLPHAEALLQRHAERFLEQGRMRALARWLSALQSPSSPLSSSSSTALRSLMPSMSPMREDRRRPARLVIAGLWSDAFGQGPRRAWAALREVDGGLDDPWSRAHLAALKPLLLAMLDRYEEAATLSPPAEDAARVSAFAAAVHSNAMAHVWSVAGPAALRPQSLLDRARGLLPAGRQRFAQAYTEAVEGLIDLHEGRLREALARLRRAAAGGAVRTASDQASTDDAEPGADGASNVSSSGPASPQANGLASRAMAGEGARYNHGHGNVWAGVLYATAVYETGQSALARTLLQSAQALVRDLSLPDHLILTMGLSARIAFEEGEVEQALGLLDGLEQLGHQRELPRVVAAARLELGWLRLRQGRALAARESIARADIEGVWARVAALRLPAHQHEDLLIARSRWALSFGTADDAPVAALREGLATARRQGSGRRALKLQWLLAMAHRQSGDWAGALALLRPLLARTAADGYQRLILDEDPSRTRPLLQRLQAELAQDAAPDPLLADHVQRLLLALPETEEGGATDLNPPDSAPPLTRQELRVLQLLAEGYSNTAMADSLAVSDSTVRTHLRSINAKLGVHSRGQALAAARRLAVIR